MPWQWLLDAVGLVLGGLLLFAVLVVGRRRLLARPGGTFDLSLRVRHHRPGRGWLLGIGRYREHRLECFRIFSLSPRPRRSWERTRLTYVGRRDPVGAEAYSLFAGHVIVGCESDTGRHELAMSPESLLGLQAWLESAPPDPDREG